MVRPSKTAIMLTGFVSFCAGALLMILPWSTLWESNHFLQYWRPLEALLVNDVARIAVSCLGLVDFAVGFAEMRRLSDPPPPASDG